MGVIETSEICQKFRVNTKELGDFVSNESGFTALAKVVASLPTSNLRAFGAILMREELTRKACYKFGQAVYVRYRGAAGANYLSNFMKAYIMYVDRNVYKIMSHDGKCTLTFYADCAPHILSREEFVPLRNSMLEKGRMVDPDVRKSLARKLRAEEDYELSMTSDSKKGHITTIDKVFKESKIPKNGINDLCAIVANIERGYKAKGVSENYTKERKKKTKERDSNRIITIEV